MPNNLLAEHPTYQKLAERKTHSHRLIDAICAMSLSEYLSTLVSVSDSRKENRHTEAAAEVLRRYAVDSIGPDEAQKALQAFQKFPAIQVADHIGCFHEPTNFLNNILWNRALEMHDIEYQFTSQCETVRALQQAKLLMGPAFLKSGNAIYNIFGLSRNQLKNINVAAMDDSSFAFELQEGEADMPLPDILQEAIFQSPKRGYAPDMFHQANRLFWEKLPYEKKRKLMIFDRRFFSDVLAENIVRDCPILEAILFDDARRSAFLATRDHHIQTPANLALRNTTDFFHLRRGKELLPLKVNENGTFFETRSTNVALVEGRPLQARKPDILHALQQRDIYPDLLLSNVFGHVLPEIVAVGGTSQVEYLPVIVNILTDFLQEHGLLEPDCINRLSRLSHGRLIGPSLVTLDNREASFIESIHSHSDIEGWQQSFVDRNIGDMLNINFWNYFDIFYDRSSTTSRTAP